MQPDPVTDWRRTQEPNDFETLEKAQISIAGIMGELDELFKLKALPSLFKLIEEDLNTIKACARGVESTVNRRYELLHDMDSSHFEAYLTDRRAGLL